MPRLSSIFILLCVLLSPLPTYAAATPCDDNLFTVGQLVAIGGDTTPPPFNPYLMHWQALVDGYIVDYWQINGIIDIGRLKIAKNGKVLGLADNATWQTCHPSQAWKKAILNAGGY